MHQQQPLAFTLVKTVVCARDEGKPLSPALATAWAMLRGELPTAQRMLSEEVSWGPDHQTDLRLVIDGVRAQFARDPDLEDEFLTFLAEVPPFASDDPDERAFVLPLLSVAGDGAGPSEPPTPPQQQPPTPQPAPTPQPTLAPQPTPTPQPSPSPQPTPTLQSTPAPPASFLARYGGYLIAGAAAAVVAVTVLALGLNGEANDAEAPTSSASSVVVPADPRDSLRSSNLPSGDPALSDTDALADWDARVDSLRQAGDFVGAVRAQETLTRRLETTSATTPALRRALTQLAILHAATGNHRQAVVEARKSLDIAYARADDTPRLATGRAHLRLARYYAELGETHMSQAHLRQARHVFGHAQVLATPEDRAVADRLAERLDAGS